MRQVYFAVIRAVRDGDIHLVQRVASGLPEIVVPPPSLLRQNCCYVSDIFMLAAVLRESP
jgi:hypothetical protein